MKIDVIISADYIDSEALKGKIAVVIDMLRATSVITTALYNGAKKVIPVVSVEEAFEKAKDEDGNYHCACCGVADKSRIYFQVDHIVPMNKGGKSVVENLQILCRQCNGTKGDQ